MNKPIRRAALLGAPQRRVTSPDETPLAQLSLILAGWVAATKSQMESTQGRFSDTPIAQPTTTDLSVLVG
jgi:hypothetical protein